MKIGIDARMYRSSVAGIGRYSQNLIKNLLEIDHNDEFVLFMTPADQAEFKKLKINPLNADPRIAGMTNQNVKIVNTNIAHYSLAEQTKLPKIIEEEKLDLMHFLHFNLPVNYRGKYLVTIHDLTLLFYPQAAKDISLLKNWGFKYVMKRAVKRADKIIAVSENTKKDIIKVYQTPPEKIKVIYEGADEKIFTGIKNKKVSKPIILYVGQIRKHKNIAGLTEAYKILKKQIDCQLVILGGRIDKIANLPDIVMPGFVTDCELALRYKNAAVLVMPSFYEGFGLTGLEAMKAGTPVVASNTSALPEIYQDAALYFDPFNVDDIADKIKMVIQDKKLRQNLIAKGHQVSKKYSWRKTAEETLDLYKQIQKSNIKN